jgi:hypothetical protein
MEKISNKDFVEEENGDQFLLLSITRIKHTLIMDLLSINGGAIMTVFSPPRKFRKKKSLDFQEHSQIDCDFAGIITNTCSPIIS